MKMTLTEAALYYGRARYPIDITTYSNYPFKEVEFAPLEGELLDEVCRAVAKATGCLSMEAVKSSIYHNIAMPEMKFEDVLADGGDLIIPPSVQLLGNGFSVIWK